MPFKAFLNPFKDLKRALTLLASFKTYAYNTSRSFNTAANFCAGQRFETQTAAPFFKTTKLRLLFYAEEDLARIVFILGRFSQLHIVKVGGGWLRYSESCSTAPFPNRHPLRLQLQFRPLLPRRFPILPN